MGGREILLTQQVVQKHASSSVGRYQEAGMRGGNEPEHHQKSKRWVGGWVGGWVRESCLPSRLSRNIPRTCAGTRKQECAVGTSPNTTKRANVGWVGGWVGG